MVQEDGQKDNKKKILYPDVNPDEEPSHQLDDIDYLDDQFGELENIEKKEIVNPEFSIDSEGRVVCETHSEIKTIKMLAANPTRPSIAEYEQMLNCTRCGHYANDDCYFPQSEIDKIEIDRKNNKLHCPFCGLRIDRPLTLIYSFYYKDKYNVDVPYICCECYRNLSNNTLMRSIRKKILILFFSLVISIYFFLSYFITIFMYSFWGIILFIVPFGFWGVITLRELNNLHNLIKGRKYFERYFSKNLA